MIRSESFLIFSPWEHMVAIFKVSWAAIPAIIAFVDAIAGMMFFTTPCRDTTKNNHHLMLSHSNYYDIRWNIILKHHACVCCKETPGIPNNCALSSAFSYTHCICSWLSASNDSSLLSCNKWREILHSQII